jgi:archaemetzincin
MLEREAGSLASSRKTTLGGLCWAVLVVTWAAHAEVVMASERGLRPSVCVIPLGSVDPALVQTARAGIDDAYAFPVSTRPTAELPAEAWYAPRGRYRAEKLLEWLDDRLPSEQGCSILVGLTTQDISTTKDRYPDWGIFGLAEIEGKSAVVSTFRLVRVGSPESLLRARLVKVVNHELGHVLGLGHCATARCLMEDAKASIRTVDAEDGRLCPHCASLLGERYDLGGGSVVPP